MFREPQSTSNVDEVLDAYSKAIYEKLDPTLNGALLTCVIGGKLSEGTSFEISLDPQSLP